MIKAIINGYKSLYYTLYVWILSTSGRTDIPEINAVLGVSLVTFMNFLSLYGMFTYLLGLNAIVFPSLSKLELIILAASYLFIQSFIFFYKKRYQKIIIAFSDESSREKKIRNWGVIFYIFLSPLILIFTLKVIS